MQITDLNLKVKADVSSEATKTPPALGEPEPVFKNPQVTDESSVLSIPPQNRPVSQPTRVLRNLVHYRQILTVIQVAADAVTICLSFLAGYWLWSLVGPYVAIDLYEKESLSRYTSLLAVTLVTTLLGLEIHGLYKPQRSLMNVREFELILKTWIKACLATLGILYLAHQLYFSRGVFVLTWGCMLTFLIFQRYAFFKFNNYLRRRGFFETTVLIYGAGVVGRKLLEKFKQSPKLGYHVAGFIDDSPQMHRGQVQEFPVLGDFSTLINVIRETGAKRLFIALPQVPSKVVIDILNVCRKTGCDFQIVPSLYDIVIQRVKVTEVEGIPLIGVSEPTYSFKTMLIKRIFDIMASAILLIALSPLLLGLALIVKLTSKGPVFFVQKRVGKNGRKFRFYKFRSMYVDSPIYAFTPQDGHDTRITPIGRFLRRSSLDELPQLWNVLTGSMSLVGPRPEMPFIVQQYNELQRQRLNVKPGITGLWQISADRKNAIHENMDYDIYYINNQSLLLDLVILLRTVFSCIRGIGAH